MHTRPSSLNWLDDRSSLSADKVHLRSAALEGPGTHWADAPGNINIIITIVITKMLSFGVVKAFTVDVITVKKNPSLKAMCKLEFYYTFRRLCTCSEL